MDDRKAEDPRVLAVSLVLPSSYTCTAIARKVGMVFQKMHHEAYDGAMKMTGKTNGLQINNPKAL